MTLLPHLLDPVADRAPDRDAVRCDGAALAYAALVDRADRLAAALREAGVTRGDRVGLFLDKGLDATTAMYGTMRAGAAYVPLDASAPPSRLAFILRDCGIRHLVTSPTRLPALSGALADTPVEVCIGVEEAPAARALSWNEVAATPPLARLDVREDDLAYLLYTSGSTGTPKGVVHTHRSAAAWAHGTARRYGLRPDDRLSSHAPLHFDLSTFDYFAAAAAGATTVVVPTLYTKLPASLSALLQDERVSVLYAVPFALALLRQHGALDKRDLSALRWVLFAGEPFAPRQLRDLMKALPEAQFSNIYGPTETNGVTAYDVPSSFADATDDDPLPIGTPLADVSVRISDETGAPVAPGEAGELLVDAPTTMQGYWGHPERTAEAFIDLTGVSGTTRRYHRTGDLVRQRPDGNLMFLGRLDRQVKTRGYRVELSGVEAVLAGHEAVAEAAAFAVPDGRGSHRLVAAVSLDGEGDAASVRAHAQASLPSYAVPEAITVVGAFPRTPTGKVDRLRLRDLLASESTPAT